MDDVERNKAVVARFDELGNAGGDLSALDVLCTPDMVNHALAPGREPGHPPACTSKVAKTTTRSHRS
jgi:hypothetical protein